ncbi:MAG: GAF domain-containing protein [Rhodoferax sp.]
MTTPLTPDQHLTMAAALAHASEPAEVYRVVDAVLAASVGFGLFTLLVRTPDGQEVSRVYSTNPHAYPLAGRKRMGLTPWGALVLEQQQCYLTNDAQGIAWAFPDHALIASLGLSRAINVPLVAMQQVFGTINLLDGPGRYTEADIEVVRSIAPYLVRPFQRELSPG